LILISVIARCPCPTIFIRLACAVLNTPPPKMFVPATTTMELGHRAS